HLTPLSISLNKFFGLTRTPFVYQRLTEITFHAEKAKKLQALPYVIEKAKNAKIVASKKGKKGLMKHYGENLDIETVKTGDRLKLENRTLKFI
ncbi:MAG: hypothetical protein N3E52_07195, partial [Candidatus Bathyarchaeota archaeon]|nr:hypothetical protein [Candidatus Bathyarchaeota archaeon]